MLLIHTTERGLARNRLYMAKLPTYPLQEVRPHVNPAFEVAKLKGLLYERPHKLVLLIWTLDENIHMYIIHSLLD